MTQKKDLKRRVRARQAQTKESYVAARRAVMADRQPPADADAGDPAAPNPSDVATDPPSTTGAAVPAESEPSAREPSASAIDVVEMEDATAIAAELGFKCTVAVTGQLTAHVESRAALERLRDVLLATTADPALERMRAVVFRNDPVPRIAMPTWHDDWYEGMRHFLARVEAGIGGVSENGTMLALPVQGKRGIVMMVAQLGWGIVRGHGPRLVVTTSAADGFHIDFIAERRLRVTPTGEP